MQCIIISVGNVIPKQFNALLLYVFHAGDIVLHSQMAVETLGRWQNPGAHDGPGRGHLYGCREKAEEKNSARLPVGEPAVPQLVDLQVLPVRNDGAHERCG